MPISVDGLREKVAAPAAAKKNRKLGIRSVSGEYSSSRKIGKLGRGVKSFILWNIGIPFAASVGYGVAMMGVPHQRYSLLVGGVSAFLLIGSVAIPKFNKLWVRLSIGFLASQVLLITAISGLEKLVWILGKLIK